MGCGSWERRIQYFRKDLAFWIEKVADPCPMPVWVSSSAFSAPGHLNTNVKRTLSPAASETGVRHWCEPETVSTYVHVYYGSIHGTMHCENHMTGSTHLSNVEFPSQLLSINL